LSYTNLQKRFQSAARCVVLFALMLQPTAWALDFPYNALRWVTHSAAGGSTDAMVRTVAAAMGESLGKQVVVENQLGAGGVSAASLVLKSGNDGHTWLAADNGILVLNAALYKSLPYDRSSFQTLGLMARAPLVLVASPQAGFKSAKDMLDNAKANPNKLNYASIGTGSSAQLAIDLLSKRAGLQFVRVPLGNDVAAVNDVLAGQVSFTVTDLPNALPHLRSGKLQALAVFTPRRIAALPDAPSFAELGLPDLNVYLWQGLAMPAKAEADAQTKVGKALQAAIAIPSLRKRLSDAGWELLANDGGFASAYIGAETATWHRLIKEAGIKAD
jgi:tripartite-type tricarboxylate transporter receptor subunit TctC